MALSLKSLVRIREVPVGETTGAAGANMVSFFAYATKDADTVVEGTGYWNAARDAGRIKAGDVVDYVCSWGGTQESKKLVFRTVPASGNVTIALISPT